MSESDGLISAADRLRRRLDKMHFDLPVTHVYNPLNYAFEAHRRYLSLVPAGGCEVMFLGMNPGPWGMAQTGVPFGEIDAVRNFLGIEETIQHPENEHPKRVVTGFECPRSEVSGRRLWGLFAERYKSAAIFCRRHFVMNYCPLVFMEQSGRNRTPDKLPARERSQLDAACDEHLVTAIKILSPRYLIGIGAYAEKCLARVVSQNESMLSSELTIHRVLHPSPASPAANKDWAGKATKSLVDAGIWKA